MPQRRDTVTANRVDLVLILLPFIGLQAAARSAVDNGVPFEVAMRVLTRPGARRRDPAPKALDVSSDGVEASRT